MMSRQLMVTVAALVLQSARCLEGGDKFDMSVKAGNWTPDHVAAGSEDVEVSFWVKQTHLNKLKNVLDSVSDPKSPNYGHYLTKQEIDDLTAPTEHDVHVVETALHPHKIQHKGGSSILVSTVPVSFATELFGGKFMYFCRGDAEQRTCVLRNPTAEVPAALHEACDIITPLNDPLPPVFHGPIVSPSSVAPIAATSAEEGCCFSYGFGAMMKPCCLSTHMVTHEAACNTEERVGGATHFKKGACPVSAEEAADGVAQAQQLQETQGCCISIGYGDYMKPCCLSTRVVTDEGACPSDTRDGGATFYHSGKCPLSADEASSLAPRPHAPIVSTLSVAPNTATSAEEGCCFSYGLGSMMKPCCLSTHMVTHKAACNTQQRMGGATHFKKGTCPVSAEDAAASVAQAQQLQETQGCCISIGYGAYMKPCCLNTQVAAEEGACPAATRTGGRTFYHSGKCPISADEAALLAPSAQSPQQAATPSVSMTTESTRGSPLIFTLSSTVVAALLIGSVVMWLRGRQEARNAPLLEYVPE